MIIAPLTFSVFTNAFDTAPTIEDFGTDWRAFVDAMPELLAIEADDKVDLPAIGPYLLREGATRSDANVERVTAIVLDVDAVPRNDVRALLLRASNPVFAYASPSDTPTARRIRIIAPLNRHLKPTECAHVRCAYAQRLGLSPGCGVERALDPSRLFFAGKITGTPDREWWAL